MSKLKNLPALAYAVVYVWEDNPNDVYVVEYFETIENARKFMKKLKLPAGVKYAEIMKYN